MARARRPPASEAELVVGIVCGGERHRGVVAGADLLLPDHEGGGELLLAALGAPGRIPCLEVRDDWRAGHLERLPTGLRSRAVQRWERAGVPGTSVTEFVAALRTPARIDPPARNGNLSAAVDAALWYEALGRPPTPEDLVELRAVGVEDSSMAGAWSDALGRPLRPADVGRHRAGGILDGYDAQLWRRAVGELPAPAQLRRWRTVDVRDGWDAMCWAQLIGDVPTVEAVRALQAQGVIDPPAIWAARHR